MIETVRNAIQANLSRFARVRERLDDDDGGSSPRDGEARALATLGYVHDISFKPYFLFHDAGWDDIAEQAAQPGASDRPDLDPFDPRDWPDG